MARVWRPMWRSVLGAVARKHQNAAPGVGGGPSAFSAAKAAIVADAGDVSILVLGDSTGDFTDEWVYLFAQWLGTQYPTHSVSYRLFNNGTNVYGTATAISTGSGSNTIRIWNASVGGTNPVSLMLPTKYPAAVEAITPDLIIWNYGHNLYTADAAQMLVVDNAYSPWVERVQFTHPDASVALFTQNPRRDDNNYAAIYSMICEHAADKPRATLIDSYALFMAAGKAWALYSDNIHPSAAGSQLYLSALTGAWERGATTADVSPPDAWLSSQQANLLLNGDFAAWPSATPTSWTLGVNATASKELTIVDSGDTYSMKIEQTGAGQASVSQLLDAAGLAAVKAAGRMSFAVRRNAPTSADTQTGYILVSVIAASGNVSRTSFVQNVRLEDEFYWTFIRDIPIPSDATSVRCYLYASGVARDNAIAYFSRAIAVAGDLPRDMA